MSEPDPPHEPSPQPPVPTILHATALARQSATGRWRGVLLRGPSGVGKSDLALRAAALGWRLVADDRSLVFRSGSGLFARAPATIAGLIEARGLGVLPARSLAFAELVLAVDCADDANGLERVPEWDMVEIMGASLQRVWLLAREASAVVKLGLALDVAERRFDSRPQERI